MCMWGGIFSYAIVKQTTSSTAGILNCSAKNPEPAPQICASFSSITLLPFGNGADVFQQLSLPPLQCRGEG